jgi:putative hemolysin
LEPDTIPFITNSFRAIEFYPFATETVFGLLALAMLLLSSALISASEVAFFSLSPSDKELFKDSEKKTHQFIRGFLKTPDKLLATILIANNFINVGIVILATYITNTTINFSNAPVIGFLFEVIIITFLLLLFGEILPKIYASSNSLSTAGFMARPLRLLEKFFWPLVVLLTHSTLFINKRFGSLKQNISVDELSHALELTSEEELSDDKSILESIVKFGSTDVDQIMTPRIDVVAVEIETSGNKLLNIINQNGYSRIPVYTESFDNINGILYIKDLLPHFNNLDSFQWQKLIRPPYFVPENKKIDDLLKEFQKTKVHMAIVVDEYGGTSGIITLEDILEEIVGDIIDEFDDDDQLYSKVNNNTYLFDAKIQLNDFTRICEIGNDYFKSIKGEADSLAGLILEMKGDFPKMNESLKYKDLEFTIESIDKRRIKKVKVTFNNLSQ